MKLSYLIDTDWIIHYLNGHREIIGKLKSLRNGDTSLFLRIHFKNPL